jgi:hypothetical protein
MQYTNADGSITTGIVLERMTQHGNTPVVMDYEAGIMRGLIDGASSFSSNGDYVASGAITDFPVHEAGAVNISLAGAQMSFVSSSADDSASGTGLRTLAVGYIEHSTLTAKTEIVAMNGNTPVLSVATNIRFINSLTMLSAGSGGKNAGAITATNGGLTYGAISIGHRVQASSYRMVPADKIFVPRLIIASSNSGTAAAQAIFHIVGWSSSLPFWIPSNAVGCQDGPIIIPLHGRSIPAGSIIGVEATTDKAAHVTASIIGHLENA